MSAESPTNFTTVAGDGYVYANAFIGTTGAGSTGSPGAGTFGAVTASTLNTTGAIETDRGFINAVETIAGNANSTSATALSMMGYSSVGSTQNPAWYSLAAPTSAGVEKEIFIQTLLASTGVSVAIKASTGGAVNFNSTSNVATCATTGLASLRMVSLSPTVWQILQNTGTWLFTTS